MHKPRETRTQQRGRKAEPCTAADRACDFAAVDETGKSLRRCRVFLFCSFFPFSLFLFRKEGTGGRSCLLEARCGSKRRFGARLLSAVLLLERNEAPGASLGKQIRNRKGFSKERNCQQKTSPFFFKEKKKSSPALYG